MSLDDFNAYLGRLYDGDHLEDEIITNIDRKAADLLELMQSGGIDYDTQNSLDLYVSFYDGSRYLDSEKNRIIMGYYNTIEERKENLLEKQSGDKPSVLSIKPINSDGIINAITIIEIVVIGGILAAFLVLALIYI